MAEQVFPSDDQMLKEIKVNITHLLGYIKCDGDVEKQRNNKKKFIEQLKTSQISETRTDHVMNDTVYEVSTDFIQMVCGSRIKFSGCYWPNGVSTIDEAEDASLALICERARIEDGQTIMDLGGGWGALALYICEKYPNAKVCSLSNSRTQRELVQKRALERDYQERLDAITADISVFETNKLYDRIVCIEVLEYFRNYERLLKKVSGWLHTDGMLFTQLFCHKDLPFSLDGVQWKHPKWMERDSFRGMTMLSADLLLYFQDDVALVDHWYLNGTHFSKTSEAFLSRLNQRKDEVQTLFNNIHGELDGPKHVFMWKVYFHFWSLMFSYKDGNELLLAHHLFKKRS